MPKNTVFHARLRVTAKRSIRAGTLDAGRGYLDAVFAKDLFPADSAYHIAINERTEKNKLDALCVFERWGRFFIIKSMRIRMTIITPEEQALFRRIAEDAAPGIWHHDDAGEGDYQITNNENSFFAMCYGRNNADFIVQFQRHNALRLLDALEVAEIRAEKAEAERDALLDCVRKTMYWFGPSFEHDSDECGYGNCCPVCILTDEHDADCPYQFIVKGHA